MFNLPVGVVTVQGDREESPAAGMDDYVTKPFRVDARMQALLAAEAGGAA